MITPKNIQRPLAETRFREELEALKANDFGDKPANWELSPRAVRTFILGSEKPLRRGKKYVPVSKKFY
jgi:hypothetical protein